MAATHGQVADEAVEQPAQQSKPKRRGERPADIVGSEQAVQEFLDDPINAPPTTAVDSPELLKALATAHLRIERLHEFVSDMAARLFCLELHVCVRQTGRIQGIFGLGYVGGASQATYDLVRQQVLDKLVADAVVVDGPGR